MIFTPYISFVMLYYINGKSNFADEIKSQVVGRWGAGDVTQWYDNYLAYTRT
jgi:hypothetical protein